MKEKKVKEGVKKTVDRTLRGTIVAQLIALGWFCSVDFFEDKSASWIEVFKENPKDLKEGNLLSFVIMFNYEGTIITDVRFFEQKVYIKVGDARCVL